LENSSLGGKASQSKQKKGRSQGTFRLPKSLNDQQVPLKMTICGVELEKHTKMGMVFDCHVSTRQSGREKKWVAEGFRTNGPREDTD